MKIGTASYGGDYTKRTYAKLKDGDQSFRILPPLGELAEKGRWSVFWSVHYGYKNSAGKLRIFQSPLVKNQKKMVEVPDAALDRINKWKAEFEAAKKANPVNREEVARLNDLVGQKGQYNLDSNHYMNAVDAQGNIVVLKLRHRAKMALDQEIKALRDKGVDPLSVENGRYFVFRRTGMGLDTTFKVSVQKEKITVPGIGEVERDMVHVLSPDLISRLSREAIELDKIYKRPSADDVARIVAEGTRAVDEIFDTRVSDAGSNDEDPIGMADESPLSAPVQTASAPVAMQVAIQAVQTAPTPTATVIAPQSITTHVAVPLTATAAALAVQSDDDFLKSMGIN